MRKELSIAIDMDDVLAKTTEKIIQEYTDQYGMDDLVQLEKTNQVTERVYQLILELFNKPGFARDLGLKEDAVEVVAALNEKYDIFIATAAMEVPGTFHDKFHWLEEHFPFLNPSHFIFCGNKKVVQADFLIDDTIQQLDNFTGIGILYTAALNEKKEAPYKRLDTWCAVREHFLDHYEERLTEAKEMRKVRYQDLLEELNFPYPNS